ncbi:hypothetical protein LOD99_9954 [Oopsacas minuta]|uniref:UDP-N-acetylglucosamine diphosphorylase n=1 Tax=Oopsacas minuta TaxID=111878 RepID=A0AAV7KIW6_9METZ|nr:hypothetical protein LOD99_9954 [Oopsacas minuta]
MELESARQKVREHNQEQLLRFSADLSNDQLSLLTEDIHNINFDEINEFWRQEQSNTAVEQVEPIKMEPIPPEACGSVLRDKAKLKLWEKIGMERISKGKVCAVLLAGGQGTRLGVTYPKGMYNIGLLSEKSLYQIQAERLLRLQTIVGEKYNCQVVIPWYIMTSEDTKNQSVAFFKENKYFGIDHKQVIFFEQKQVPCLDFEGKILLKEKHRIAKAPGGNGALYEALELSGVLSDMVSRGIEDIHVYCVDNVLVKIADPIFTGFCVEKNADCGNKVVKKLMPSEPVGVFARVNGEFQIVEYSELSFEDAEQRDTNGELTFRWGNIAIHYFRIDFLLDVAKKYSSKLPYHSAKKKIPYVDADGKMISPSFNSGIKMEKFVFDVFQFSKNLAVLEIVRENEFAPLKNPPGVAKESPYTSRAAVYDLHYRFILAAGGSVVDKNGYSLPFIPRRRASDTETSSGVQVEICPSITYFGEGLEFLKEKKLENNFYLHKKGDDLFVTQPLHQVMQTIKRPADESYDIESPSKRERPNDTMN